MVVKVAGSRCGARVAYEIVSDGDVKSVGLADEHFGDRTYGRYYLDTVCSRR